MAGFGRAAAGFFEEGGAFAGFTALFEGLAGFFLRGFSFFLLFLLMSRP
jgi:hypothetical protein